MTNASKIALGRNLGDDLPNQPSTNRRALTTTIGSSCTANRQATSLRPSNAVRDEEAVGSAIRKPRKLAGNVRSAVADPRRRRQAYRRCVAETLSGVDIKAPRGAR